RVRKNHPTRVRKLHVMLALRRAGCARRRRVRPTHNNKTTHLRLGTRERHMRNPKSKIQNRKSRRSHRRGIVLLMVVSLLALFVLLGATFTLVALHAVNASKLELRQEQYGDQRDSEMDLVLGQILYDTAARTVLQYHSLLRDLYGYDANLTW